MYLLPQDSKCIICKRALKKGSLVISIFIGDENYHFCQDHDCKDYNCLATAILKFRNERNGKTNMPPITDYEYQLLLSSGAMLWEENNSTHSQQKKLRHFLQNSNRKPAPTNNGSDTCETLPSSC